MAVAGVVLAGANAVRAAVVLRLQEAVAVVLLREVAPGPAWLLREVVVWASVRAAAPVAPLLHGLRRVLVWAGRLLAVGEAS